MILKEYSYTNQNLAKLHKSILTSGCVSGFNGLTRDADVFLVLGGALLDETALDALIAAHDPTEVPESITPRQARQALFLNGITAAMVEGAINQLPSPNKELALIEWEFSTAFLRSNPLVNQIGAVFGKSSADIDSIWILGASL